jgi:Fuc2NAc and GlcNAc transferase
MLDMPNHRSSHRAPTPRGGGVSFVISFLSAIPLLGFMGILSRPIIITLTGPALFIALLGFLDDRVQIAARWRLVAHFCASLFALYCLGGMQAIPFFGWSVPAGFLLGFLTTLYLVWLLNLYNFMDGIDGIAGIQAVSVCLCEAFLYFLTGHYSEVALPLLLAGAVMGFLYWNFPVAKIFMGDVGSGFLGFMLGIMSVYATRINGQLFWSWLILSGVFIVDATVTLLRRAVTGFPIFEAHRSHAYQHAAYYFKSHLAVTLAVLMINLIWLLPWSILVAMEFINGTVGLIIAYAPILLLVFKFKAGKDSRLIKIQETSLS